MFRACRTQPSRIIASSSSHSSLHTSAVQHGRSSHQHVARAIKKSNIKMEAERQIKAQENRPHVILGTRKGEEEKWQGCLLAKVLVDEKELSNELVPTKQTIGTVNLPTHFNFGIGEAEKQLLFRTLPILTLTGGKDSLTGDQDSVATKDGTRTRDEIPQHVSPEAMVEVQKVSTENLAKEHRKANAFARIIDLRNANAAGIAYENRKRIVEAFSKPENPFDTGRPEVQAALLTYRIRNLWTHLDTFKRDLGNRRGLRMLVHQRAKILRYLKRVDQTRYEIVLEQLALEPESVEGELVV